MRGTVGMRLLGMQIGHATDGRTLPMQPAAEPLRGALRPTTFVPHPAGSYLFLGLGAIMCLLGLVIAIGWFIACW